MDRSDPSFDSRMADWIAKSATINDSCRQRLEELGLNPDSFNLSSDDPNFDKVLEIRDEQRRQFQELQELIPKSAPPPQMPFCWEGEVPVDRDGTFVDVCTREGLTWLVDDGVALFNSRLHREWPSGATDGLSFARTTIRNAYRAAIENGLSCQIPSGDVLENEAGIEVCWHELRRLLGGPNQAQKTAAKSSAKRGRRSDTDREEDRRIFDAWGTDQHPNYAALANERGRGESGKDIERAIDRHRKWIKRGEAK